MQPGRHQKIPRAFGRGRGDDRRLEFVEARVPHPLAEVAHHGRAQHDVVMQLVAAQIEEAVPQAGFLWVFLVTEDHQRKLIGCPQNF